VPSLSSGNSKFRAADGSIRGVPLRTPAANHREVVAPAGIRERPRTPDAQARQTQIRNGLPCIGPNVIAKPGTERAVPTIHRDDILPATDRVGHRGRLPTGWQAVLPKQLAIADVEGAAFGAAGLSLPPYR
jgi:hypothetical protein